MKKFINPDVASGFIPNVLFASGRVWKGLHFSRLTAMLCSELVSGFIPWILILGVLVIPLAYAGQLTKEEDDEIRQQAEILVRSQFEQELKIERLNEDLRWFYRTGDYVKAREVLEQLLKFSPDNEIALKYKEALVEMVETEERLADLEIKDEVDRQEAVVRRLKELKMKLWEKANIELIGRAMNEIYRKTPEDLAKEDMLERMRAIAHEKVSNEQAEINKLMDDAMRHLRKREFLAAKSKLNEVLKINKDYGPAHLKLKEVEDERVKCEALYAEWVKKYLDEANNYIKAKRWRDAKRVLDEALTLELLPKDKGEVDALMAKIMPKIKDWEEVQEEMEAIRVLIREKRFDEYADPREPTKKYPGAVKRAETLYLNNPGIKETERLWTEARRKKEICDREIAGRDKASEIEERMTEVDMAYRRPATEGKKAGDIVFELPLEIQAKLDKVEIIKDKLKKYSVLGLDFTNAPINEVLEHLSAMSGIKFVPMEIPEGTTVTIKVSNIPIESVLKFILVPKNLTYSVIPDGVWVGPDEKINNIALDKEIIIYPVKFLSVKNRQLRLREK